MSDYRVAGIWQHKENLIENLAMDPLTYEISHKLVTCCLFCLKFEKKLVVLKCRINMLQLKFINFISLYLVFFSSANLKGLLHYPICRAQLREPTCSEVGRLHDLPQITHFDVGESGWQPAVFVYLTFLIDEIGFLNLYNCILSNSPISSNLGPRRLPKSGPASWVM